MAFSKSVSAHVELSVMFGSDCMYWPDELENSINKLNSFEFLDEQDKRKIRYENAVRFFDLDHFGK